MGLYWGVVIMALYISNFYKKKILNTGMNISVAAIVLYLIMHVMGSARGLPALLTLHRDIQMDQRVLAELEREYLALENLVGRLREESLDLDILDEQARYLLGYIGNNETYFNVEMY